MEAQCVKWKIEGEFITNLARSWFWDEDKPYEICEELLLKCLCGTDTSEIELKIIAQNIIEGRKKLVGINSFDLEDDNKNIRPITLKLEEIARKAKVEQLRNLMITRMIDFVDPYCTVKSKNGAIECEYINLEECKTWFWYSTDYIDNLYKRPKYPDDTDTMLLNENDNTLAGLWLCEFPEIAYKAISLHDTYPSCHPMKEQEDLIFWNDLYNVIKDDTRFQSKYFKKRNENYLAEMRMEEEKKLRESGKLTDKCIEDNIRSWSSKELILKEEAEKTISYANEWLSKNKKPEKGADVPSSYIIKYHTLHMIAQVLSENIKDRTLDDNDRHFMLLPDSYNKWEGLIAPNGDFYSCDFGGHNAKAYHLICAYPEKFPNIDYEHLGCDSSNSLDDILRQGWCATRYLPIYGCYIELPRTMRRECTKAQKDAIFDAKIRHNVAVDLSPIGY